MQSSSQQSGARPSVLIRDPLAEDLIGASRRHGKARLSPQTAHGADGKSLLPFWRRWWRAL